MARAVDGTKRLKRRKKILKQAKGYWGRRSKLYKPAKEAVTRALCYAYRDRRRKKRDFRSLWIARISAACRAEDMSYSRFIHGLNLAGVGLNRKAISNMAIEDPQAFKSLVETARQNLTS